jgi:glucokinase
MPIAGGWSPIEGEGGHVTIAPADAQESAVLELLRNVMIMFRRNECFGGAGLLNLYNALCEIAAVPAASFTPPQITDPRPWGRTRAREMPRRCSARCSERWRAILPLQ